MRRLTSVMLQTVMFVLVCLHSEGDPQDTLQAPWTVDESIVAIRSLLEEPGYLVTFEGAHRLGDPPLERTVARFNGQLDRAGRVDWFQVDRHLRVIVSAGLHSRKEPRNHAIPGVVEVVSITREQAVATAWRIASRQCASLLGGPHHYEEEFEGPSYSFRWRQMNEFGVRLPWTARLTVDVGTGKMSHWRVTRVPVLIDPEPRITRVEARRIAQEGTDLQLGGARDTFAAVTGVGVEQQLMWFVRCADHHTDIVVSDAAGTVAAVVQ